MVSKTISGADGIFAASYMPVLTISFENLQTSPALTLDFDLNRNEWCDITITYLRDGEAVVSYDFTPNSSRYCCVGAAELYDKVTIAFTRTSVPYRRARLTAIFYGIIRYFSDDELT